MVDIDVSMERFIKAVNECFGERIYFIGLQGSYGRGEATETSDIDAVVVLDRLTADDIQRYRDLIDALPHRELMCGFLAGKDELLSWAASDVFQLYYDTTPLVRTLDALLPRLDAAAVDRAIRIGACNIYHGCVHNMVHRRSVNTLRGLYKLASFVVQAIAFRDTGRYIRHEDDLLESVTSDEQEILSGFIALGRGDAVDFDRMSECLFHWAGELIRA